MAYHDGIRDAPNTSTYGRGATCILCPIRRQVDDVNTGQTHAGRSYCRLCFLLLQQALAASEKGGDAAKEPEVVSEWGASTDARHVLPQQLQQSLNIGLPPKILTYSTTSFLSPRSSLAAAAFGGNNQEFFGLGLADCCFLAPTCRRATTCRESRDHAAAAGAESLNGRRCGPPRLN